MENSIKKRWAALKKERSSWDSHWQEISENLLPRAGRFGKTKTNDGSKKHRKILDRTGMGALRIMSAGLMAGMTSPARPWFRLDLVGSEAGDSYEVREWCSDVTDIMRRIFHRSNLYRAIHMVYEELGAFGTGAMLVLPDYKDVIRCYPLTIGEYAISTNYRGEVDTLFREFGMTVSQLVGEFGIDNVSDTVRQAYHSGNMDQWITVIHAIEPRQGYDKTKSDNLNMPFRSCYMELGAEDGKYLRESGFKRFPVLAPRWATSGGDIYGNSPGMEALGDIKQLAHEQLRKGQGIDYKTNPPLQVPAGLKNRELDMLPGGITYVDMNAPTSAIRTAFEVNLDLSHLLEDINDVRSRINNAFYADMFLMLANSVNTQMTATEVAERHEEKMLMLGPVVERLDNELLDPLIELTFGYMADAGLLPPPPQSMQGSEINVEFVSMLAQAQRAIGVNSIDRFVSTLANVAQVKPEILDRLNADALADKLQDHLGVDPDLLVSKEEADALRNARAQAQARQEQMAMIQQAAATAKDLSATDTTSQNGLTDVAGMFSGYTSPGVLQ